MSIEHEYIRSICYKAPTFKHAVPIIIAIIITRACSSSNTVQKSKYNNKYSEQKTNTTKSEL